MDSLMGLSPSDIIKLVEISTRIYDAFNNANLSSAAQVEALVREFGDFHHFLVMLDALMKEYNKPLPFPCSSFKETLERCDKCLEPYREQLVDRKMSAKKFLYTVRYIGKENEVDWLRRQIAGHYQVLHLCISFLQLRLQLEATKETQRLLAAAPFRAMSFAGKMYTNTSLPHSTSINPRELPDSEADVYKDWAMILDMLKHEEERLRIESRNPRPLSCGDAPTVFDGGDAEKATVLSRWRQEAEAALTLKENRVKRTALEKSTRLSPSSAVREGVRSMPQAPLRTYTLETDHSGNFSAFNNNPLMQPLATVSPQSMTQSPAQSVAGSPNLEGVEFAPVDWEHFLSSPANAAERTPSVSTYRTSATATSEPRISFTTAGTTPEHGPQSLVGGPYTTPLELTTLGAGAMTWQILARKVLVERTLSDGAQERECDLYWRYRKDTGITIRSSVRSPGKNRPFVTQNFPATGPAIPQTTTIGRTEIINFPLGSCGRLDNHCIDIKYTFNTPESSFALQKLLYTSNGTEDAELLYDRPIQSINSNLNKPECRGKNIRLWGRREPHGGPAGIDDAKVLVLLFFTENLGSKAHWVEEPHYVFEWLDESTYKKSSDKLKLVFSRKPDSYKRDKVYKRQRKDSRVEEDQETAVATRRLSSPRDTPNLHPADDFAPLAFLTRPPKSNPQALGGINRPKSAPVTLNRFGYSEFEIKFQSKQDRQDFLAIWKKYVKPLGQLG
ncbi:hypothetical protein BS50DRAFT_60712 [Corynespora cassiicola Philippines]|uniref:Fungal N-terminal domain-containing protein n=1 Tax=Corynespora cassiicola Philippines TaxID=1448308 RepID=A0A2T2NJU1_CORCC|nr:hypothetical protein BS50DRAFT_60712 [Corynespora cassiicola Philippines]